MRPLVALGARISSSAEQSGKGNPAGPHWSSALPLAFFGRRARVPVLGLILTGAALQGASVQTTLLLLTYAAGAATSLALALVVGGRVFAVMKKIHRRRRVVVRRGLGVAVLAAVVAITLGVDTGFLTNLSVGSTTTLEQGLLDKLPAEPEGGDVGTCDECRPSRPDNRPKICRSEDIMPLA